VNQKDLSTWAEKIEITHPGKVQVKSTWDCELQVKFKGNTRYVKSVSQAKSVCLELQREVTW